MANMKDIGALAALIESWATKRSPRFNGVVSTDEGDVKVTNGIGKIGGEAYYISDDGRLVVDKNGRIVAVVINGKAQKITPEIAEQLKSAGLAK